MTRILLTGASGFVGRQIILGLDKPGVSIIPVVRSGKEVCVMGLPNVERVVSSKNLFQESEAWWKVACENVDVVIHSAWHVQPGSYLQAPENIDCLIGSLNLAKGAKASGVRKIVGIGTCFEYEFSMRELSIFTPIKPLTTYAATKAALFFVLKEWLATQSIDFSWCRLFYLYGEGEDARRFVPYLRGRLEKGLPAELTDGNQIRDFMNVADAGKLIAGVALGNQIGVINICSGLPVTIRQFAERIADEYGRRDLLRFGARSDNLVDPQCIVGIPNHGSIIPKD